MKRLTLLVLPAFVLQFAMFSKPFLLCSEQTAQASARISLRGDVSEQMLIKHGAPKYPSEAKKAGIRGVVVLKVEVDQKGMVEKITAVSGPPKLYQASIDAVKKWKYKPLQEKNQSVPFVTTATLNFGN